MDFIQPIDLEGLQTYSINERTSKVSTEDFGRPWKTGGTFSQFLERLPHILASQDLRAVITAGAAAWHQNKTVIMAMGAHVIKTGLNPVLIDLMEQGFIKAVALNGAGIIHDFEVALTGRTSEDVAASLGNGSFGTARETGEFLSAAIQAAQQDQVGLGYAVGRAINTAQLPQRSQSILAAGARLKIPVCVLMAMGTDILHIHPGFDPGAAGAASHRDFKIFAALVATLEQGMYFNIGSAVILPEVFLKAITLVRNLGHQVNCFTSVNLDFMRHYRPMTNVVQRPVAGKGKGYNLIGHHEIMLPLVAAGIMEEYYRKD